MANVRLKFGFPTVTARQKPTQHAKVDIRVSPDLPWTLQDTVTPDVAVPELLFQDAAPGTHFYRVTVVDVDGNEGEPRETSANVPFDPPGTVTNLTAVVE